MNSPRVLVLASETSDYKVLYQRAKCLDAAYLIREKVATWAKRHRRTMSWDFQGTCAFASHGLIQVLTAFDIACEFVTGYWCRRWTGYQPHCWVAVRGGLRVLDPTASQFDPDGPWNELDAIPALVAAAPIVAGKAEIVARMRKLEQVARVAAEVLEVLQ